MTIDQRWPLQVAVCGRLSAHLQGQGIGGEDVPVFDHVPVNPPRLHVRIDGFSVFPGGTANGDRARHDFLVHIFDDNSGTQTGAGMAEIARLMPIVVGALRDWPPMNGATGVTHISSNSADGGDPMTFHAVSRFSTLIGV